MEKSFLRSLMERFMQRSRSADGKKAQQPTRRPSQESIEMAEEILGHPHKGIDNVEKSHLSNLQKNFSGSHSQSSRGHNGQYDITSETVNKAKEGASSVEQKHLDTFSQQSLHGSSMKSNQNYSEEIANETVSGAMQKANGQEKQELENFSRQLKDSNNKK
ncbi:hypothetical protein HPB58_22125 [Priestia filamentosa]|uniref:hypothetical protein n=1 Tax=Priestia filamentosa TaxID=1402861 RepID=UPI001FB384FE|nr:hypothetical protein [Priestia filamentosa]UOE59982.1 hypothetical protein HPB58_22125 [Priestia filamentosa]